MSSPYADIACCIDESDASGLALAEARRLRALGPGALNVLHAPADLVAYPSIPLTAWVRHPSELAADAERWLDEQVRTGETPVLLSGYPAAAACEWARLAGCDLIVAAAHRSVAERVLLGGFATYLAYHAPCPVLLVRPTELVN
jgi:nucleotide-binding universal stress UspA family protein